MCPRSRAGWPRCAGSCGPTGMRFGFREWTQGNESAAAPCGSKGRSGTVATGAERTLPNRAQLRPEHIRNARPKPKRSRPTDPADIGRSRTRQARTSVTRATGGADRRRKPGRPKGRLDDRGSGLTSEAADAGARLLAEVNSKTAGVSRLEMCIQCGSCGGLLPVGQRHGSHPQRAVCTDPCRRAR